MAETTIQHVALTVTEVGVFVQAVEFLSKNGILGDAQSYLEQHGKTEMLIDAEVISLLVKFLSQDDVACNLKQDDSDGAFIKKRLMPHWIVLREWLQKLSS